MSWIYSIICMEKYGKGSFTVSKPANGEAKNKINKIKSLLQNGLSHYIHYES